MFCIEPTNLGGRIMPRSSDPLASYASGIIYTAYWKYYVYMISPVTYGNYQVKFTFSYIKKASPNKNFQLLLYL